MVFDSDHLFFFFFFFFWCVPSFSLIFTELLKVSFLHFHFLTGFYWWSCTCTAQQVLHILCQLWIMLLVVAFLYVFVRKCSRLPYCSCFSITSLLFYTNIHTRGITQTKGKWSHIISNLGEKFEGVSQQKLKLGIYEQWKNYLCWVKKKKKIKRERETKRCCLQDKNKTKQTLWGWKDEYWGCWEDLMC